MVRGKLFSGQDDLTEIKNIRKQVFQKELSIPEELEEDGQDAFCMHVLAYDGELPVATGRISYDGFEFVISRVAVLKEYRRKKYGDFIIRMLVDKALMANAQQVQLDAFEENVPFFEGIGFKLEGQAENLAGKMLYKMILHKDSLHKCCNCK